MLSYHLLINALTFCFKPVGKDLFTANIAFRHEVCKIEGLSQIDNSQLCHHQGIFLKKMTGPCADRADSSYIELGSPNHVKVDHVA